MFFDSEILPQKLPGMKRFSFFQSTHFTFWHCFFVRCGELRKLSLFSKSKSEEPDRKRMPENSRSEPILPELPDSLGSLSMNGISENEVQDLRAFPGSGGGRSLGRSRRATQEQRMRRASNYLSQRIGSFWLSKVAQFRFCWYTVAVKCPQLFVLGTRFCIDAHKQTLKNFREK